MKNKQVNINHFAIEQDFITVGFNFVGGKKERSINIDNSKFDAYLTSIGKTGIVEIEQVLYFEINGEIEDQVETKELFRTITDYLLECSVEELESDLRNYLYLNPIQPPLSRLMKSAWIMAKDQCITIGQAMRLAWQMAKLVGKKLTITFFKKDKSIRTVQGAEILGLKGNVVLYKEDEQIKSFISTNLISSHISE